MHAFPSTPELCVCFSFTRPSLQVLAFFERLEKSTSKGQTLLQLSSKYAMIVHEDPPPMKGALDFAGFFKMFLPASWLMSVQGVPLSEVLAPRRALFPRRLPGLANVKKVLPNGSILEEKVEIAVQVCKTLRVCCCQPAWRGRMGLCVCVVVAGCACAKHSVPSDY
jgi:hypothetical protein